MEKSFFPFLMLLLLSSFSLYAQKFNSRLIFGVNGSQIDGDDMSGFNKGGITGGVGVDFPLNDLMSLQSEIRYSQKGSRFNEKRGDPYLVWRVNSIDMPLLLNFNFNEKVRLQAGVAVNYLISAKADLGDGYSDMKNDFYDFNYVSLVGIGYLPAPEWELNVRYGYSIATIREDFYYRHNYLSFTVNYILKSIK